MLKFLTLKQEAFGMDISDFSIKLAKLKRHKQEFDLACFGEQSLPKGLIESGLVKNEQGLAEIIRWAVKNVKGEKMKTKQVVCCLPEEKSFLRIIQLPKMTPQELAKVVPFEAENYIPIPLKDCYLDFEVIEPLVNHLDHFDVLLAAIPQPVLDPYLRSLKLAGLRPCAFEPESLAITRALIKNMITVNPIMIIDLGATRTNLIIFSGRAVRFVKSLNFSADQLTRDLAEKLKIPLEKAEKLKLEYGLIGKTKILLKETTGDSELDKQVVYDREFLQILIPTLEQFALEVRNFLDFYYTHASHEHSSPTRYEVKKIILSGGGSIVKGLDEYLSQNLNISVVFGNPWVNILEDPKNRVPDSYLKKALSYTNALGLALRGVISDYD